MKFEKWFIGLLAGTLVLAFAVGTALAAKNLAGYGWLPIVRSTPQDGSA